MSTIKGLPGLFVLAMRNWHKPIGLIISIMPAIIILSIILQITGASWMISLISYSSVVVIILICWIINNRFPKTKKGKVGFVVSIYCSDEKEGNRIKEDFIYTIKDLLAKGPLGSTFQFITIPQYLAKKIYLKNDLQKLKSKTRSNFVIYGRVRLETIDGREHHIIELDGLVTHNPIPDEISKQFALEFRELLPSQIRIQTENDFFAFETTSKWTECIAKYIIGIASALSFKFEYSEILFTDVKHMVEKMDTNLPTFIKIKERLPVRFMEIFRIQALLYLSAWRKSRSENDILLISKNLNKIPKEVENDYQVTILRSVEAFLNGRNVDKAIDLLKPFKKVQDSIRYYNLAFLFAYKGELRRAIQLYRKGLDLDILADSLFQIEDFMEWILKSEPDKYQMYYCLGFFNWKVKGDKIQAINDFEIFLSNGKDSEYKREKELAQEWITELRNSIKNEPDL